MSYIPGPGQRLVLNAANSTATPLLNGGSFTGTSVSTAGYAAILVEAKADQDMEITFQYSNDGTNWDVKDFQSYRGDVGDGPFYVSIVAGTFFRIVVDNDGADQTVLRINTYMAAVSPAVTMGSEIIQGLVAPLKMIQVGGVDADGHATPIKIDDVNAVLVNAEGDSNPYINTDLLGANQSLNVSTGGGRTRAVLTFSMFADQDSDANGFTLTLQFSTHTAPTPIFVSGLLAKNTPHSFSFAIPQGLEVVASYGNGAIAQGVFQFSSTNARSGVLLPTQLSALGNLRTAVQESVLPTGAATETTLAAVSSKLPALVGGKIPVDIGGETVIIAIPAGASTAAKQDTGNTSLASIDTKLTDIATQTTLAQIKAKTDNIDVALSTRTKPADSQHVVNDAGTALMGKVGIDQTTPGTTNKVSIGTDGTVAVTNLDVALSTRTKPSDQQHAIVDSSALPTGAATETTLAAVNTKLGSALPLPTGAATETTLAAANTNLGTDGATPPTNNGTGIRGWLRTIYDKLSSSIAVTGTFWQATQPVSAATLPLPALAATSTKQSDGTQKTQVVDGSGNVQPAGDTSGRSIHTTVDNASLAVTGPLTDTALRASAVPVSVASLPLPTGAATETTLAAVNTKLGAALPLPTGASTEATLAAVNTKLGSALPLPTGASTGAKQDTGNTSLASIDTKLSSVALDGTDGATPPTIPGTGIRGWLRSIYDLLNGILTFKGANVARTSAAWTSSTTVNTALTETVTGYGTAIVTINPTTSITGGVLTFEVSDDNSSWFPIQGAEISSSIVGSTYTLVANTLKSYQFDVAGYTNFRVRLSTVISGTATVTIGITANAFRAEPVVGVGGNPQVAASGESGTIFVGGVACTPLFANITASSSGVTNVLALVSSKRIRVIAMALTCNAGVNVKFQSHVTPTDITGLFYCGATGGLVLPRNDAGWFQTVSGEALDINLSAAVAVGGVLTYITV